MVRPLKKANGVPGGEKAGASGVIPCMHRFHAGSALQRVGRKGSPLLGDYLNKGFSSFVSREMQVTRYNSVNLGKNRNTGMVLPIVHYIRSLLQGGLFKENFSFSPVGRRGKTRSKLIWFLRANQRIVSIYPPTFSKYMM